MGVCTLSAQVTPEVEALKQQLQQIQRSFEAAQAEHRRQVETLSRQIEELEKRVAAGAPAAARPGETTNAPLVASSPMPTNAPAASVEARKWSPSDPITLMRSGPAYMNIGFDVLMAFGWSTEARPADQLQLGANDPNQRGFTLQNAELVLSGAVDPYFSGLAVADMRLDANNETQFELEEAYLETKALPANLQVKAGYYYASFGRQNSQHPHAWAFVDQPLILNRLLGPDGLRNPGAQLAWLAPLPFYTELAVSLMNGTGNTAFSFRNPGEPDSAGDDRYLGRHTLDRDLSGMGDFLYVPRLASSFDLSETQTLMVGASGAVGPNDTAETARTEILGVDAYWKWKPVEARSGVPFVSWQTEALWRHFDAGADPTATPALSAEEVRDYGFYSQVLWGFMPRWVAGFRGEWVSGNNSAVDATDIYRGDRIRLAPGLTWYPTEYSKIRLQYNYDRGQHFDDQHSVWLQAEFMLGAHAAHKF